MSRKMLVAEADEKIVRLVSRDERAWNDFVSAQKRSLETLAFEDGLAARRAYRHFMAIGEETVSK